MYCSIQGCIVVYRNVLQYTGMYCSIQECIVVYRDVLQYMTQLYIQSRCRLALFPGSCTGAERG